MFGNRVEIDSSAFARFGVRVGFDEDKYTELLDALADSSLAPPLAVLPHKTMWTAATRTRREAIKSISFSSLRGGNYNYINGNAIIFAPPDVQLSNQILIHEIQHWADHMNGARNNERSYKVNYLLKSLGISALIGADIVLTIDQLSGDSPLGVAVAIGVGLVTTEAVFAFEALDLMKRKIPLERHAYDVQEDPEMLENFGDIISFTQL